MDPWGNSSSTELSQTSAQIHSFQDAFVNSNILQENDQGFAKLADSADYLKVLENKLKNLEKRKESGAQQTKEDILGNLLRSESKQILGILSDTDINLDQEVETSQVLRQLVPQQPLTVGETIPLVNSDLLDKTYSESTTDSDMLN
jgi:hypothetical protein